MDDKMKKIAALAYELGIEHERAKRQFTPNEFRRKIDTPKGAAQCWICDMDINSNWGAFERRVNDKVIL